MKCIAHIVEKGKLVGIVDGPDEWDQVITVAGRKWHFDFDEYCGPSWLKADGLTLRKNQNPKKAVWDAFQRWADKRIAKGAD